jgi:leucyl aminopeptidase
MSSAHITIYGSNAYKTLDKKLSGQLAKAVKSSGLIDKDSGEVEVSYPGKADIDFVTVVKIKDTKAMSSQDWRDFGGKHYSRYMTKVSDVYFDIGINEDVYDGACLAGYTFDRYKSKKRDAVAELHVERAKIASAINTSVALARDFVSEPGNALYPAIYANRIVKELAPLGVNVKIYNEEQLREMGFNLLLSVGQGSEKDSYVVVMEWMNGGKAPTTALVGKGVTFDTGGISLKPGAGMADMKYDMAGSAAVVGAMHAIASSNMGANVVGIVGLVENMPDGAAIKPGDIVTSLSGQTVENLNTDAEGRLVLADVLTHVQREYDPATIVDLATLTGAILVSLGKEMAGLFTNSTELETAIISSGKESGEQYWRMPMGSNWNSMLDSPIADIKNISAGGHGGSTTAAEFLYRFVDKERAWAHLDIAGMAWESSGKATVPAGAVGFGVRTLYNLVKTSYNKNFKIDDNMKY